MEPRLRSPNPRASFKIEFPGDKDVKSRIQNKFARVKSAMQSKTSVFVNNTSVLEFLLDNTLNLQATEPRNAVISGYVSISDNNASEDIGYS